MLPEIRDTEKKVEKVWDYFKQTTSACWPAYPLYHSSTDDTLSAMSAVHSSHLVIIAYIHDPRWARGTTLYYRISGWANKQQ